MDIGYFEPESLIELDDLQGFRKLALVAGAGDVYVDLISDDAQAWPLYRALNPMPIGNSLLWSLMLMDQWPDEVDAFHGLHQQLLSAGLDTLTFNRALYWAYQVRVFDFAEALAVGRDATARVQNSHQFLNQLAKRGLTAHLRLI